MGRPGSVFAVLVAVGAVLLPSTAEAIPAFARKYGVACTACHTNWPRLNRFGINFRDNGYRMNRERDNPVTQPGTYWPIAFRSTVGYQYAAQTQVPVEPTPSNPNGLATTQTGTFGFAGLDILTAGTLGEQINFLLVYTPGLGGAGFGTSPSDGDLESAWVGFTRLLATPFFNVRVGKMSPDLPVDEHRTYFLTQGYQVYHFVAQGSAVTYGPGDNQAGVEVYGHSELSSFRYSVQLANEGGQPLYSANWVSNPVVWAHVQYYHLTGNNVFVSIEPGVFGATGWQAVKYLAAPGMTCTPSTGEGCVSGTGSSLANYYRIGGELHFQFLSPVNPLTLDGVVMFGSDSSALINGGVNSDGSPTQSAQWMGGFAELSYTPSPDWTLAFMYQRIATLQQGSTDYSHAIGDFTAWAILARYYIAISSRAGVALHAEFSQASTTAQLPVAGIGPPQGTTVLLGVDFAY